ncbi:hypothetical protein [Comamonas kerstersii]|uniref:hypothetical protein n=1 Tax=Comamonas kerstersii TaxID=225992 RepID=UPI00266F35F0|nr:hypothetical protein [Comamonas kerstersii]
MSEPMPSWAQALIESNLAVSQALQAQAKSQQALAEAIVQLVESQMDDAGLSDGAPAGYLDGTLG